MNNKIIFKRSSVALAVGAAIMFSGLSTQVYAQETEATEEAKVLEEEAKRLAEAKRLEEEADNLEEVIVTGSRISRSNLSTSTPLQVVNSEAIELAAQVNIGDLINQLPAAGVPTNRTNANFLNNASGLVTIDLRNLGTERTLTLVNGRRFVAGVPGSSAVDLNAIPTALIERAELITGGASAVYGSDAVSGVVNFVMKDDYEGFELSTRIGESDAGDADETSIDLLFGRNFDEGRGNAVFNISYTEQGAVFSRDRERSAVDEFSEIFFGGEPFEQRRPFFSSFPPQGRFDATQTGTGNNFTFLPDGTLVNNFVTNGDAASGRGPDGFNRSAFRTIAIPIDRFLVNSNVKYDFTDTTSFFFEGTYANTQSQSRLEPFPLDSDDLFSDGTSGIPVRYTGSDGRTIIHPFLPQPILAAADGAGVENIRFRRRLVEFGARGARNERQTFRGVLGLEGSFNEKYSWDVSFNYGQSTQSQSSDGQVDVTAFRSALLSERDPATGQIRCVDAIARANGCAPINVFGFNSIDQNALAFVSAEQSRQAKVTQQILQANLTGPLFKLPAGDLQFAVGFEYRDEESDARNDALTVRGLNSSNAIPSVIGSFDVSEVYAELDIPLIEDGFVDYANLAVAARASDYSTVGSTSTYETRLEVRPVESLTFRGSVARAVRAPNVDELFDPGGQTFAQVQDPCNNVTAATGGVIADNCRADPGIAARIAATGAFTLTQSELQGTTGFIGGNPDLEEEEADTFTVGFVYLPKFLPESMSASLTVDYFDIEISNAISAVSQNNTLNLCYESVGLSSPLCSNIVRFAAGNTQQGALNEVNSGEANVAEFNTSGIDVALGVDFEIGSLPGTFGATVNYTYLDELEFVALPNAEPDNEAGEIGDAENQWNAKLRYATDRLSTQLEIRYIGESRIDDTFLSDEDCATLNCVTDATVYTDFQARYTLPQSFFGDGEFEVFGGVRNLFDEEAPLLPGGLPESDTGLATDGGTYDAIGRSFYVGAKIKF